MAELINPGNRDPAAGEVEEAEAEGGTFRLLVERSPVAMGIVDREGRIEYANPALAQRYGEALAGARTVAEFVELGALDVADAQRGLDYWREAILGWKPGDPEPEPYEGRIRSGEDVKHVLYRFTMIGSRVVVVVEDVTGFRRAEELEASNRRLRISEAKYRRLHQSITDACATIDLEGRITDFNPAFGEMLGYSAAELRQLTYREVTPERWHALEQDILREQILVHGHSEVYEKEYRRKDGTIVPVELRCFLVRDDNGEPVQSWAIIRDITERKCMEERLRQSNASLEERVAERTAELDESVKRYQTLFDAQADMVIVTDAGNRILEANQAACEQLGYSREELFRLRHTDFGTPLPETEREEVRRELLAGRAVSVL